MSVDAHQDVELASTIDAAPSPPRDRTSTSLAVRLRDLARDFGRIGKSLPSEPALAKQLGVSRPALREELARLESEGMIRRRQGAGTIVNAGAFEMVARFDQQIEFVDVIRDAGYEPTVEVVESSPVAIGGSDAEALSVAEGSPALRTVKRWWADATLVLLAIDVIPVAPERAMLIATADPQLGLFELVRLLRSETVEWELAWPSAVHAPASARAWLDSSPRTPLLTLDLVGISRSGARSYRATEYHVPGPIRSGFIRSVRS